MTWRSLVADHLQGRRLAGHSPVTLEIAERVLHDFVAVCCDRGAAEPGQALSSHVAAYRQELLWRPGPKGRFLSPNTVSQRLGMVRTFFRWAVSRGHLLADPTAGLLLRKPPLPLGRVLSNLEVEVLLSAPDPTTPVGLRDRAILATFYGTGLRNGECHRLDLTDVDLRNGALLVRRGKGGHPRQAPVGDSLAAALAAWLERGRPALARPAEPALWVGRDGRRLGYQSLQLLVLRHAEHVGIRGPVRPHTLRRTFATHLLENGADLRSVQELLGHAFLQTTQRYTALAPVEVFQEHGRTHPRASRSRRKPKT